MTLFRPVTVGGVRVDPNVDNAQGQHTLLAVAGNPLDRREVQELLEVLQEALSP